jgi:mycothiol synthase
MIEVTRIDEAALGRWVAIHNAVRPRDPVTGEDMIDWRKQADDTAWFLTSVAGVDAGIGVGVIGWHSEPGVARTEPAVLEEHRNRGVGSALLAALAAWARTGGQLHGEARVDELDISSQAWAQRRGFVEIGRDSLLVLDLAGIEAPTVDPPEGIEIVSWAERPDAVHGIYEVACEAYPDVPGEESNSMEPFESWLANDMQGSGDRPEATFVALAGDDVVGFAKLSLSAAVPDTAGHDITGVKRAWRGRGIAGALKRAEIAWAKDQGYNRLRTHNEARNTPIRLLNERHGYVVEPGSVTVRGPLPR